MVFESFSEKIQGIMKKIRGKSRITEEDIKAISRELKLALLEADVNFKVVKDFIAKISEKAMGQDVLKSLTPGQQIVKIVNEELIELLGKEPSKLNFNPNGITIILMAGLQGSGKTTASAKIANFVRKNGKKPMMIACDVYRPAAIDQLEVLGKQLDIPVFSIRNEKNVVKIASEGIKEAKQKGNNVVIVDTAGRLHVDEELMNELIELKKAINPTEILLVIDAMTGQDALNVATSFNEKLEVNGIVMSKLDGDTRGGAALSAKAVTGKPIKFASVGEKLSDLEPFYPDRMASRILGMGDVLSLIEKAQENFEEEEAIALEKKLREATFNLEDFLAQMRQIKKMGPISQLLGMIPGLGAQLKDIEIDDKQVNRVEAIVLSMTPNERRRPEIINASRKKRIAAGCGMQVQDVNRLLKQFEEMRKMMKQLKNNKKFRF
ncbi:MAG: signal recognition particle protein [Lachnospiraceae bacterium]|nr:signal recognition particle protein [Lachnospiraceae bacterium]